MHGLAELLYGSDGLVCRACGNSWKETPDLDDSSCPVCGSEDVGEALKAIPDLSDNPELAILCAAEQRIPRAENGALLTTEMVAWLALHGVSDPQEVRDWEDWLNSIGGIRAQIEEDLRDAELRPTTKPDEDGPEGD